MGRQCQRLWPLFLRLILLLSLLLLSLRATALDLNGTDSGELYKRTAHSKQT
jgi:hypothetical protein